MIELAGVLSGNGTYQAEMKMLLFYWWLESRVSGNKRGDVLVSQNEME